MGNPLLSASMIAGGFALFVGLLTFFGVVLSLKAATMRMKTELWHAASQAMREREHSSDQAARERQHSADEAHKERIATLRRSVYLEAIAELVKTNIYLGSLAKVDITKVNVGAGLEGFHVAVARVAVVAEQSTALKARAVASMFTMTLLNGLELLMPMVPLKSNAAFHDEKYAAAQIEIQRILAAMINHNETHQRDDEAFAALQRSFQQQQALAQEHSAKSIKVKLQLSDEEMKYGMAFMTDMKLAATKLDELACDIRVELGLEADLKKFQQQTADLHKQFDLAIQKLQARAAARREQQRG